ncbi:unnamed protein product [Sphagnum balticum]
MLKKSGMANDHLGKTPSKVEQRMDEIEQKVAEAFNHVLRDVANTHQLALTVAHTVGIDAKELAENLHDLDLKQYYQDIADAEKKFIQALEEKKHAEKAVEETAAAGTGDTSIDAGDQATERPAEVDGTDSGEAGEVAE